MTKGPRAAAVVPRMREHGGGQSVNISSQASTKHIAYIAGYASTKHIAYIAGYASTKSALRTVSLTAREELAEDGVTVSILKPGVVGTLLPHVIAPLSSSPSSPRSSAPRTQSWISTGENYSETPGPAGTG